jgi:hypothetical protein
VEYRPGHYEEHAFERIPILADALEDADPTDAAILDHCPQPGEHARSCWVIDLLLGKRRAAVPLAGISHNQPLPY